MTFRIEYELTFEDFAEAQRKHSRLRPWVITLVVGAVFSFFILIPIVHHPGNAVAPPATSATLAGGTTAAPSTSLGDIVLPLIPWVLVFGFVWFFIFRRLRARPREPWRRPAFRTGNDKREKRLNLAVSLLVILAVVVFAIVRVRSDMRQASTIPGESPRALDSILAITPMVAVAIFLALAGAFRGRGPGLVKSQYKRSWDQQANLLLPKVVEFHDEFVLQTDHLMRAEIRWEIFRGYVETPLSFLLYMTPLSFIILPKRAFGGEANLDAFRALLREKIKEPLSAFPVLPASTSAPRGSAPPAHRIN